MSAATSTTQKSFLVTAMLSLFLGVFGVDRFYLNKVGTGILKLITFGGFGIWYLIDLIIIYTGNAKDKNDNELTGRKKDLKTALIILGIAVAFGIFSSAATSKNTATTTVVKKTTTTTKPSSTPKIGETVRDGKFEFTITKLECGVTTVGTNQYLQKTAQGQFCLMSLTVKNIGDKQQYFLDSDQKIFNAAGVEYSTDSTATLYNSGNNNVWLAQINPGNSVQGVLVFDIPKDQTAIKAELHDSAFSQGVTVSLQ